MAAAASSNSSSSGSSSSSNGSSNGSSSGSSSSSSSKKTPVLVTRTGVPLSQHREHSRRAAPRRFTSLKPGPTPDMAQSTTSPTTRLSTEDFPPLRSNTASSSGHSSGPVRPNRATPTRDPKASQRDRVRSHEVDRARQDAVRSGATAPKNLSSALNKEGKLHVNQAMDARFAAAGMGVDEYGNGDYGTPMPPPTGDLKAYHVPQQCEKGPNHSAGNAGWTWTQTWCSSVSESPRLHAERTVPPTSENPQPNARPMPEPGSLIREDIDIPQICTSAYNTGPLCHRQQAPATVRVSM